MARRRTTKPQRSLAWGRPPATKPPTSMSRRASRSLINTHHQLAKERLQASRRGDCGLKYEISARIAALGGLQRYQEASLQGQRQDRGGDTSAVLVEWLRGANLEGPQKARMLEVGALSTRNACTNSRLFDVVLIDLNSRDRGIIQQDFMERPPPVDHSDGFDVISLSLVLNFIPAAHDRGKMLRHTISFLRQHELGRSPEGSPFPCLFVVLPRQCVSNSRYFSIDQFETLMRTLGFVQQKLKLTGKLMYSLWRRDNSLALPAQRFARKEVNPGRKRNNFTITLERDEEDMSSRKKNMLS